MRPFALSLLALSLVSAPTAARAEQAAGTLADPILIDALPYAIRGSTSGATSRDIDAYSCASSLDESGPEVVYRLGLPIDARLSAWVEGDDGTVDIDVHILTSDQVSARQALGCIARNNTIAEAALPTGAAWVVVDTYQGDAQAGPYVLHIDAIGDEWTDRPVAQGVTWRARRYVDIAGGPQVVHTLLIDPDADGLQVRALASDGCQTVGALGQAAGAVAGINGGYFSSGCAPVSLLKSGGQLLGTNSISRGAFGVTTSGAPLISLVAAGQDWPDVSDAHGGGPILVQSGAARNGAAAWAEEGMTSASFLAANPRTVAGVDSAGRILFGTVDGRRATAHGMSLDDLAAYCVSNELGLADAVNLDGGGSSTLWIAGATPNGVVNYPSDDPEQETSAHGGSRSVSGGLFVFAQPYNHAPRFQSTPGAVAKVGVPYAYDADAIDLDVDDVVSFSLGAAPDGMTIDAVTGIVAYTPSAEATSPATVEVIASDGRGGDAVQAYSLAIDGALGPADSGIEESGSAGAGGDQDSAAAGGASGSPGGGGAAGGGLDASSDAGEASGCACESAGDARARWGGALTTLSLLFALAALEGRNRASARATRTRNGRC